MEGLQDDVLLMILSEYLHVTDLVTCRLLSKRIKFLVDNFVKLKKLVFDCAHVIVHFGAHRLSDLADKKSERERPNPNHILIFRDYYVSHHLDLPRNSSFQLLCSSLRCLKFMPILQLTDSNMSTLNELSRLEELIITRPHIPPNQSPVLDLPNLKLLVMHWFDYATDPKSSKLVINSKIKNFVYEDVHFNFPFQFNHPKHVEFLSVRSLEIEDLSIFQNLRVLCFHSISESNLNVVDVLPTLEAISLQDYQYKAGEAEKVANHLMRRRRVLGRENLKIYYFGILLNRPFAEYGIQRTTSASLATLHLEHYDQLAERFPYIEQIDYTQFADRLEALTAGKRIPLDLQGLPINFFRRMNIRSILITEIHNSDRFVSFLKQCKYVEVLQFKNEVGIQFEQSIVQVVADLYSLSLASFSLSMLNRALDFRQFTRLQQLIDFNVFYLDPKSRLELRLFLRRVARNQYQLSSVILRELPAEDGPISETTGDLHVAIEAMQTLIDDFMNARTSIR